MITPKRPNRFNGYVPVQRSEHNRIGEVIGVRTTYANAVLAVQAAKVSGWVWSLASGELLEIEKG